MRGMHRDLSTFDIGPACAELGSVRPDSDERHLRYRFGTATDSSGAAIPNVDVTATASATGVSTKVVTNESGNYIFPNLQPGVYTVSCQTPGFRKAEVGNVLVEVNQRGRVDLAMQVGEIRKVVAVKANVTTVDTFRSTVKEVVDSGRVRELPFERPPIAAIAIAAAWSRQRALGLGRVADRHQYSAQFRRQRHAGELVVLHGFSRLNAISITRQLQVA
jgi:hypothetical protein